MKRYLTVLLVTCTLSVSITLAVVSMVNRQSAVAQPATQSTPPTIYLAHCDVAHHWQTVITGSQAVARDEEHAGFWPVTENYYHALNTAILRGSTCVPGPMDSPHN